MSLEGHHRAPDCPLPLRPGALQEALGLDWIQDEKTGTHHPPLRFDFGPVGVASWSTAERIAHRFDQIISIGTGDDFPPTFLSDHPNRLLIPFDDVTTLTPDEAVRRERLITPSVAHARQILATVRRDRTTLIHCYGGVSRSPAAAFIALMNLGAPLDEILAAANPARLDPNDLLLLAGERALRLQPGGLTEPVRTWHQRALKDMPVGNGSLEL
jgi:predicted protein tyrosine phosphatase